MPRIKVRAKNTTGEQPFTHEAAVPSEMTGRSLLALARSWGIRIVANSHHDDSWSWYRRDDAPSYIYMTFNNGDMLVRENTAANIVGVVPHDQRRYWWHGLGPMTSSGSESWFPTYRIELAPTIEAFRYDGPADIPDLMAWVDGQGIHVSRCEILCNDRQMCYLYGLKGHLAQYGIVPGDVVICSANISQEIKLAVWGGTPLAEKWEVVE